MQEKLIEILSSTTSWLTAAEIADQGGWRSAQHVGLALKQMNSIEHRTSPTKKSSNGMPAKEYKLLDKQFDGEKPQAQVGKNSASKDTGSTVGSSGIGADPLPVCNAVSAPPKPDKKPAAACADDLHKRIEQLEQDVSKQRALLDAKRNEVDALNDDIRRHVQRAEAAECNRDDVLQQSQALLTDKTNLLTALGLATAEKDRLHAENLALKVLDESMPGFGAAYEAQKAKKPAQPRRPFSVTGLVGYHAGSDKVTLFLDRRLSARSVTLPASKLAQLAEMAGAQ